MRQKIAALREWVNRHPFYAIVVTVIPPYMAFPWLKGCTTAGLTCIDVARWFYDLPSIEKAAWATAVGGLAVLGATIHATKVARALPRIEAELRHQDRKRIERLVEWGMLLRLKAAIESQQTAINTALATMHDPSFNSSLYAISHLLLESDTRLPKVVAEIMSRPECFDLDLLSALCQYENRLELVESMQVTLKSQLTEFKTSSPPVAWQQYFDKAGARWAPIVSQALVQLADAIALVCQEGERSMTRAKPSILAHALQAGVRANS